MFAEVLPTWSDTAIQYGAFGLLTYIVVWMYPRAAADARAERENRDRLLTEALKNQTATITDAIAEQTKSFGRMVSSLRKGHPPESG